MRFLRVAPRVLIGRHRAQHTLRHCSGKNKGFYSLFNQCKHVNDANHRKSVEEQDLTEETVNKKIKDKEKSGEKESILGDTVMPNI